MADPSAQPRLRPPSHAAASRCPSRLQIWPAHARSAAAATSAAHSHAPVRKADESARSRAEGPASGEKRSAARTHETEGNTEEEDAQASEHSRSRSWAVWPGPVPTLCATKSASRAPACTQTFSVESLLSGRIDVLSLLHYLHEKQHTGVRDLLTNMLYDLELVEVDSILPQLIHL